jgi:Fe-S-cluster-containing dehydrogenase component
MPPLTPSSPGRRAALKLFVAGAASLIGACRAPAQPILPYREMPDGLVPGMPQMFATSLPLAGAGRGALVESHYGRPTKIHGNPLHPASLGGTDVFMEAETLSLFDPERSRMPVRDGIARSWGSLQAALSQALFEPGFGEVALVSGPVGSPTLARQISDLLATRNNVRWYMHRPALPPMEMILPDGPVQLWPEFPRVRTIVTIGCDALGPGPSQIAFAKGWSAAKRRDRAGFRTYVFEAEPSLTGAKADRRHALRPSQLPFLVARLAAALEGGSEDALVAQIADRLKAGGGLVLGGPELPLETQAEIRDINRRIAAPLRVTRPYWHWEDLDPAPLSTLVTRMHSGEIEAVIILDSNPVFDAPDFADALSRVRHRLHFGRERNESANVCLWHGPLHHALEDWSDLRAPDGTVGLVQPLISPLHDTRSVHEALAMMAGGPSPSGREIVRATWQAEWGSEGFERRWELCLRDGVVAGTGPGELPEGPRPEHAASAATSRAADTLEADTLEPDTLEPDTLEPNTLEIVVRPSPTLYCGEYAANAWLQECPAPFTKQVWGNAVCMNPADAERLGLADGVLAMLTGIDGRSTTGPVLTDPRQARGCISVTLGHGRAHAGSLGSRIGFAVAGLSGAVRVEKADGTAEIARTQIEFDQHGRDILKSVALSSALPETEAPQSFYRDWIYDSPAWGMVIDTDACIGCNACVVACQSENNVPVVGPEEVRRGRRMHWLRIDTYDLPEGGQGFQPVPCMHCEKAPCEPVCPVAASVHDEQGLNLQVYNRCVGTRFCQANCPYQVRRFNFFDYAHDQAYANQGSDLLQALRNPEVSVRGRGVMEKCTYCIQRIETARQAADAEGRPIRDGEVVTACQSACPTEAIVFGDLADPDAAVTKAKRDPRHYALLEELGTRPRTTYLARVDTEGETG